MSLERSWKKQAPEKENLMSREESILGTARGASKEVATFPWWIYGNVRTSDGAILQWNDDMVNDDMSQAHGVQGYWGNRTFRC